MADHRPALADIRTRLDRTGYHPAKDHTDALLHAVDALLTLADDLERAAQAADQQSRTTDSARKAQTLEVLASCKQSTAVAIRTTIAGHVQ